MARRVVVTGMGLVTALGNDLAASWKELLAGRSGVARITRFDPQGFATRIAAEVKNFDPVRWIETIQAIAARGATTVAECAPGKVLTGLNKRIDGNLSCVALTEANTVKALLA